MRTFVYVDGYNFYYAFCKGTSYKWLNLKKLSENALGAKYTIEKVYVFTAKVKSPRWDPSKGQRQSVYWRALSTVPEIEIVPGHYREPKKVFLKVETRWIRAIKDWACRFKMLRPHMRPPLVKVIVAEEKRSDVNLATRLLIDTFQNAFDCAVVVSNDSDLVEPIRQVRNTFGKCIGLLSRAGRPCKELSSHTTFSGHIDDAMLASAVFPQTMKDAKGEFHAPHGWC